MTANQQPLSPALQGTAPSVDLMAAAHFAALKHADQRRKDARSSPYVNHVLDVARRLSAAHSDDQVLIAGGLLHDIIEDCADWSRDAPSRSPEAMSAEIQLTFGADVDALVWEVTDDKTLDKARRKELQVSQTSGKSVRARRVKLADLSSNLDALPETWDVGRKSAYLDWAAQVGDSARGVSAQLETEFDAALADAWTGLGDRT